MVTPIVKPVIGMPMCLSMTMLFVCVKVFMWDLLMWIDCDWYEDCDWLVCLIRLFNRSVIVWSDCSRELSCPAFL